MKDCIKYAAKWWPLRLGEHFSCKAVVQLEQGNDFVRHVTSCWDSK